MDNYVAYDPTSTVNTPSTFTNVTNVTFVQATGSVKTAYYAVNIYNQGANYTVGDAVLVNVTLTSTLSSTSSYSTVGYTVLNLYNVNSTSNSS